jgi:hypothetical protein
MRILIVEDDALLGDGLARGLRAPSPLRWRAKRSGPLRCRPPESADAADGVPDLIGRSMV